MRHHTETNAANVILSFEEISEIAHALRGIPYVRRYAERVAQASMVVIDVITRELSEKERRIADLEARLGSSTPSLPIWTSLEEL